MTRKERAAIDRLVAWLKDNHGNSPELHDAYFALLLMDGESRRELLGREVAERNRDMWKAQCEQQCKTIEGLRGSK